MNFLIASKRAISFGAMAALLAGCDGSQPPIGGSGTVPRASTLNAPSSTNYNVVYSFSGGSDGADPEAGLVYADGTLYGTTARGGASCDHSTSRYYGCGTVFSVTPGGTEKMLHAFGAYGDGALPQASLLDVHGTFYGTTSIGGGRGSYPCSRTTSSYYGGCGTVFSITRSGSEKVVYRFQGFSDGGKPQAPLIEVKGMLYGTTVIGGSSDCSLYSGSCGAAFSVSMAGVEKTLHYFGGSKDGASPYAGLTRVNGTFYGTTALGGRARKGTIFSLTMDGSEKVLHDFAAKGDGRLPLGGLLDVKGTLYGTTADGGANNDGTVFSIKPGGAETVLHSFAGSDGSKPEGSLIDVGGILYGTTASGGAYSSGTVFSITPGGQESVVYTFESGAGGSAPHAGLLDVNGTLYGTTSAGGAHGLGTVFSLKL